MAASDKRGQRIFKIVFQSEGKICEIYARQVSQGGLFGFIAIEELVFGERTEVVVDPGEETLKREFEGVRRTYLPMHAIVRIDEVEKEGPARISRKAADGDNVASFPMPIQPPPTEPRKR